MSHDDDGDASRMSAVFLTPSLSVQTVMLSSFDHLGVCARYGLAIGIYRHDGVASCLLGEMSVCVNRVQRVLSSGVLWNSEAS